MGDSPNESEPPKLIWCPYSDAAIPIAEATEEHIIPLALGGHDGFTLPVSGQSNSDLGSKIDGALAHEFFVSRARVKHDARGHSGRPPEFRIKNVRETKTGKPLQVSWGKRIELYDPIARRYRDDGPVQFEATFQLDHKLRMRFLAKTFLSAGYRIYGGLFRRAVAHEQARLLMRPPNELTEAELASLRAKGYLWYHHDIPDAKQAEDFTSQEAICKVLPGTLVVFLLGPGFLYLYGGILGEYLGMLAIPADTTDFPRTGRHDLGFVILMMNGKLSSGSYRSLLKHLVDSMPPEMRPAI